MMRAIHETLEQRVRRLHEETCRLGRKAYRDPVTKARVPTADFLRSRGICCGCNCRHCPFTSAEQQTALRAG